MADKTRSYDVIVDFWEWYRRREAKQCNPLAGFALDKCEEAYRECQWSSFGYWHAIYMRARRRPPMIPARHSDGS